MDSDVAEAMLKVDALGELAPSASLEVAHALVKQTHHELTRSQKQKRGSSHTLDFDDPRQPAFDVRVSEAHLLRALGILDVLALSLEAVGARINVNKENKYRVETTVTLLNEEFGLRVRERLTSRLFDPKENKHDHTGVGDPPAQVWQRTGRLEIQLRSLKRFGNHRQWTESESRPLSRRLAKVVADIIQYVQTERNTRAEHERRAALWRREREELERAEQERRMDQRRVEALLAVASRFAQAHQVRRCVAACRASASALPDGSTSTVDSWLEWAGDAATRLDPLTAGVEHVRATTWNVPRY
jgi:hypothetical protein